MKKVMFLGALCSDKVFYQILENTIQYKPNIAGQRHERMLVDGLHKAGLDVEAISMLPTAPKPYYNKVFSDFNNEKVCDIDVKYIPDVNIRVIKQVCRTFFFFLLLSKWLFANKKYERYIILGSVYPPAALSVFILKYFCRFKTIAYIPDVSDYRYEYNSKSHSKYERIFLTYFKKLSLFFDDKFDAYIFITEAMSKLINTKKKPFIVIECMIENNLNELINTIENKASPPVIMYAGGISVNYGIDLLIDSISFIGNIPFELWIFGTGSDVEIVVEAANKDKRIKYFGVVKHSILMQYEAQATLMINPRPSRQLFTKYSFPSKTVEYMASGTYFISTRLECIPKEYYNYITFIDEETPAGIGEIISNVLRMDKKVLHNMGMKARNFVINNKNYLTQTKKIYDFICSELSS